MTGVYIASLDHEFTYTLRLPREAARWLLDLWVATQFLDDVLDGNEWSRERFDEALWTMLVTLPSNPFATANVATLYPAVATAILKWQAADRAERNGLADPVSFVWRASYYDIVMVVVRLCHDVRTSIELAPSVLRLYGESLEDYMQEFNHA